MGQLNQKPICAAPQAIHFEFRTAENSAASLLPKLESMKESTPFLILLDVGTGSGAISVSFAKLTSDAQSTAIGLKQNVLQRAKAIAVSEGIKNIYFQLAYAYGLRFAGGAFDGKYCNQALCYLEDPRKVLREILRITRIDGIVAALESDFGERVPVGITQGLLKPEPSGIRLRQTIVYGTIIHPLIEKSGYIPNS